MVAKKTERSGKLTLESAVQEITQLRGRLDKLRAELREAVKREEFLASWLSSKLFVSSSGSGSDEPFAAPKPKAPQGERAPRGQRGPAILKSLESGPKTVAELASEVGGSAGSIAQTLLKLKLNGAVQGVKFDGEKFSVPGKKERASHYQLVK